MRMDEISSKQPVTVTPDATLQDAARLMEAANVGALLVMEGDRLAGIVTDRDIVVRCVQRGAAADARVDSAMTAEVVTLPADADVHEAYELLNTHAIRRLPLTIEGKVVGIVSVDDLLLGLAGDLARLARPVAGELLFGHHPAPAPAVR